MNMHISKDFLFNWVGTLLNATSFDISAKFFHVTTLETVLPIVISRHVETEKSG